MVPFSRPRWLTPAPAKGGWKQRRPKEAVTLSLLAQLPVVLPKLQNELGAEQLYLGMRGQHLRRSPVLDDSIGLNV